MDNSLMPKKYFPKCLFFSTIIHLQKSYICWLDVIWLGSSNNTINTSTHTHTHTHETIRERKHWKRLVSMKISDTLSFFQTTPLFYQPLPFYGKNLTTPPFFKTFENSLSPIIKGGGGVSNMTVMFTTQLAKAYSMSAK